MTHDCGRCELILPYDAPINMSVYKWVYAKSIGNTPLFVYPKGTRCNKCTGLREYSVRRLGTLLYKLRVLR